MKQGIDRYNSYIQPTWCPGCSNFGILTALKQAWSQTGITPENLVVVTDIGCAGNMADFVKTNVFHALHGRALPVAAGIKLANHRLTVFAIIGDGGCYGEGGSHFINLMRGNHDIKVVVHNNFLYSLTTGQYSPTTPKGTKTKSTPQGAIEEGMNPVSIALVNHGTFVSRGFADEVEHLTDLFIKAVNHAGFCLIDVLQPCATFNKTQTRDWYKEKIYKMEAKPESKEAALKKAQEIEKLPIGLFWQEKKLAYHQEVETLKSKPLIDYSTEKIDISGTLRELS